MSHMVLKCHTVPECGPPWRRLGRDSTRETESPEAAHGPAAYHSVTLTVGC